MKCLEKEPGKRYPGARALGDDLRRFLAGEPILARRITTSERTLKWARRKTAIAALLGLLAVVSAFGLGGVIWEWREAVLARDTAEEETRRTKFQTDLAENRLKEAIKSRAEEKKQTDLAERRLREALSAQAAAQLARQDAERASDRAKAESELAGQRLYDVRMNFVERYWEDNNIKRFQQTMADQLLEKDGPNDRRGFRMVLLATKVRLGTRYPGLAARRGARTGVQPGRNAPRDRQQGRDGKSIGNPDRG